MSYKVNHYAAKAVNVTSQLDIEALAIELSVGVLLTMMSIAGYRGGLWLLCIPCGLVAAGCFFSVINSAFRYIADKSASKSASRSTDKNQ
jgi:hypothetical protein